jgi:cytochrome P450
MSASLALVDPRIRDVDFASLTITDVMEQLETLQASGPPVVPVRFHDEVAWLVVGYDAVAEAFMNEADLPASAFYQHYTMPWLGRTVPSMRGSDHRIHRAFFGAPLLPAKVRARVNDVLLPIVNELIDAFAGRPRVDLVADYATRLPFRVITRLFDLPDADNDMIRENVHKLFFFPWDPDGATQARNAMIDYLRPIALERRSNPGDDLISYLASTEVDGHLLGESDLLDFVRFLYPAAGENTTNGLGLLMYRVLVDEAINRRVLADPNARAAAIEETLRIDPPVTMITRYTEKDVTIAGVRIPANCPVLLGIGAANRDARQFEHPGQFSLDRGTINHITFGRGPHFCIGAHLARAELRATLDAMLGRLAGLRLVAPEEVRFQGGMQRGPAILWVEYDRVAPATPVD